MKKSHFSVKPVFAPDLFVHYTGASFRRALKLNLKTAKTIQIQNQIPPSDDSKSLLFKLLKRSKHCRNVSLDMLSALKEFNIGEMVKLIKYVPNLTRVFCDFEFSQEDMFQASIKWMGIFKRLKTLRISFDHGDYPEKNGEFLYNKFLKALRKQRMEAFSTNSEFLDLSSLSYFPKSLKKLEFYFPEVDQEAENEDEEEENEESDEDEEEGKTKTMISLSHLQDLRSLEIPQCESLSLSKILQSIHKPDQLLSLGISFEEIEPIEDGDMIKTTLSAFKNLKKFSLKFNEPDYISGILQTMLKFPIRCLQVDGYVKKQKEFHQILEIVSKFAKLKVLKLKIQGYFMKDSFHFPASFFTNLSQMNQIEVLDLNLAISHSNVKNDRIKGKFWSSLAKNICNLNSLTELKLDLNGDLESSFKDLNIALLSLAPNLRRLELKFNLKNELKSENVMSFLKLFESLQKLEIFGLEDFPITEKKFLKRLEEILYELPLLKTVHLSDTTIRRKQDFDNLQKLLVRKKGFELITIRITYDSKHLYDARFKEDKFVNFEEIITKNPSFRLMAQPSWNF